MKQDRTAIVLTGLQKEFCDPRGLLYELVRDQLDARNVLQNTLVLVRQALALGLPVFLVPIIFSDDYRELRNPSGLLLSIKEMGAFKQGTVGVEYADELAPVLDGVRTLRPKRGLCAFSATELQDALVGEGVDTVAVGGLLTNVCVESTARTAYDLGYKIVVLSDCTATKTAEEQQASERFVCPVLGEVLSHQEFLEGLAANAGRGVV